MKLGIISDTHDEVERVVAALAAFRAHGVDRLIHCGDVTSPRTVDAFADWTVDFVLGNCDWNPQQLEAAMTAIGATLHRPFGDLELAGKKIAWIHSDDFGLFRSLENANHYDYLGYGHSHRREDHISGKTRVINPGALHRVRVPTVAVLAVESGRLESVVIE